VSEGLLRPLKGLFSGKDLAVKARGELHLVQRIAAAFRELVGQFLNAVESCGDFSEVVL
jgi:hypothetical protein